MITRRKNGKRRFPSETAGSAPWYTEGLTEELTGMERQEFFRQMALQALLAERMDRRFQKLMKFSYEELQEEHIADYKSWYDRFAFEVEGAERYEKLPTDQRPERLRKEAEAENSGQAEDMGLTKLLYDYGRYHTIAASIPSISIQR